MSQSSKMRTLKPNTILDRESLVRFFHDHNINQVHLSKIWRLMIKDPHLGFDDIPGLPKAAASLLSENFCTLTSVLKETSDSKDGRTTKLLIELQDKQMIEAVIIRHSDTRSGGHTVLCVSSQVGCKMGCTFCATGTMGLLSQLTAGEILEQLLHAKIHLEKQQNNETQGTVNKKLERTEINFKKKKCLKGKIRNIVFMGMGEPLDNYDAVSEAIEGMHDRCRFNIAWNHITVSTVGVIPKIRTLATQFPHVNLALSLHAPNQEIRCKIVPSAKAYPMDKLMHALKYYIVCTNNKVFIEYICIGNVNVSEECAHELSKMMIHYLNEVEVDTGKKPQITTKEGLDE
ncbi:hypothetical protein RFI_14714, partial [Reticulomyxa filosa]